MARALEGFADWELVEMLADTDKMHGASPGYRSERIRAIAKESINAEIDLRNPDMVKVRKYERAFAEIRESIASHYIDGNLINAIEESIKQALSDS